MQYVPGAYGSLALQLEPAKGKTFVQMISVGAQLAVYSKGIAIMAERKAYPYQASFFVGLALGKRW